MRSGDVPGHRRGGHLHVLGVEIPTRTHGPDLDVHGRLLCAVSMLLGTATYILARLHIHAYRYSNIYPTFDEIVIYLEVGIESSRINRSEPKQNVIANLTRTCRGGTIWATAVLVIRNCPW